MSCIYRCMSCRTRNTFKKPVEDYVRGRKCWHCGHGRFYVDKERLQRPVCRCGEYHFVHRPGSGACLQGTKTKIYAARRYGDENEVAEAVLEHAMAHGELATEIPF